MKKILLIMFILIILIAGVVSAGGGPRAIIQGMGYENAQYVGANTGTADLFLLACTWSDISLTTIRINGVNYDSGAYVGGCSSMGYSGKLTKYYTKGVTLSNGTSIHSLYVYGPCSGDDACWDSKTETVTVDFVEPPPACPIDQITLYGNNLIKNGGFEDISGLPPCVGQWCMSKYWSTIGPIPPADTYSNDGSYGLGLSIHPGATHFGGNPTPFENRFVAAWSCVGHYCAGNSEKIYQVLDAPLEPGEEYLMSGWFLQSHAHNNPGAYKVSIGQQLGTNFIDLTNLGQFSLTTNPNDGWVYREFTFTAPAGIGSKGVLVFSPLEDQDIYPGMDNVSLRKLEGCSANCTTTEQICDDGLDNDCDGNIDCVDSDCAQDPVCCSVGYGDSCTSSSNSCGDTDSGTIQCDGTCSATTPAERSVWNNACTSNPNSCGQTNSGFTDCFGICDATTPSDPTGYGDSCTIGIGECQASGTYDCNGVCNAVPGNPFDEVCNGLDDDCDNIIDNGGNTLCDDGVYCNGPEICSGVLGCQAGSSIDCSSYNLSGIAGCNKVPDNKPYTFDYFGGFTSVCNEDPDGCTVGVINLTHTCDVGCGAACDQNSDCTDFDKYTKDICSSSSCSCENIPIKCFEDEDCKDLNILTDDFCINPGKTTSYCENKYIIDILPRKKFLISQIRTNQLVYDEVQAGDQFFVDLNFENIGRRDTRYATIRITVSELGISRRLGPFSGPEVGEAMSRGLYVEIPKNAEPGVYTIRISLSDYNGIRRTRHRDFRIVE